MTIQHANIPEDGLHEPKGVSTAAADRVYKSDGAASGSWSQVDANTLQGTVVNGTAAGRRIVTDGTGGFSAELTPGFAFGTMNLTENTTSQAITAATDSTLRTNSDYAEVTLSFVFDSVQNMTTGSNFLQIDESGKYLVDFWANVSATTSSARFGLKFVVDGTDFVPRGVKTWIGVANEFYNLSANGIHDFTAGEQIKLYIASDKTTNVTIENLTFQLTLIEGL